MERVSGASTGPARKSIDVLDATCDHDSGLLAAGTWRHPFRTRSAIEFAVLARAVFLGKICQVLQPSNIQCHIAALQLTIAGHDLTSGLARPGTSSAGAMCRAVRVTTRMLDGYGMTSMKSVGRLRWVVDKDREDLAHHEAHRSSYRDGDHVAEQEASSPTELVLKNLALIRAYEANKRPG
jgi:hypothetical protein